MSLLITVLAGVGIGKVVDLGLKGLSYLAGKTGTKYDDKFVAFLQEHAPELTDLAERQLGLKTKTAIPRPLRRDHRSSATGEDVGDGIQRNLGG